jgi:hypothetical protein
MSNKTLSIISYITIIGWLISFFGTQGKQREGLLQYHLKQSLGLAILSILVSIIITVVVSMISSLTVLGYFNCIFIVFSIIGIIYAANEKQAPVPLIGKMFENKFSFIV